MLYYEYKKANGANLHSAAKDLLFSVINKHCPQLSGAELCHTQNGAPYLVLNGKAVDNVYVSVSHSHGMCAAAISDSPVGIDIERVRKLLREQRIFDRFFALLPLPEGIDSREHTFFYKWTYAEACYKITQSYDTARNVRNHTEIVCEDGSTYVLCVVT